MVYELQTGCVFCAFCRNFVHLCYHFALDCNETYLHKEMSFPDRTDLVPSPSDLVLFRQPGEPTAFRLYADEGASE